MEVEVRKPFLLRLLLGFEWAVLVVWSLTGICAACVFAVLAGLSSTMGANGALWFGCLAVAVFSGGMLVLLNVGLLVSAGRGKNWARLTLVVSNVVSMLICIAYGVIALVRGHIAVSIVQGVELALASVTVIVLLLPSVRRWYKSHLVAGAGWRNTVSCTLYWILSIFFCAMLAGSCGVFSWNVTRWAKENGTWVLKLQADYLHDADAMFKVGCAYLYGCGNTTKDVDRAFAYFTEAADAGHCGGMSRVGHCYQHGLGVEKDEKQAYEWYLDAQENGSAFALNALGDCCEKGIGTETNLTKAVEWWTKAAEKNHGWAACKVAIRHQKDKKPDEAFAWFRKAADIGSDYACCKLGECYERGWGTPTNAVEAAKWFVKGAERNHPWGMEKAGDFYATGYGVEKDTAKAREWYEKAVRRNGSKSAEKKLKAIDIEAKKDSDK